jgi:hypothetical protein
MKPHLVVEQLSEFLDGEASHPEAIAEHLEACPECAERLEAMRHLAGQVKSLPAPEVRPEFVTRVVARVAGLHETARPWWTRFVLPMASMVALALVVGIAYYMNMITARPSPDMAQLPPAGGADTGTAEVAWVDMLQGSDALDADEDDTVPAEDLLAALSEHAWFDSFAGAWDEEEDLDALIDSLDEEETQTFKDLVREYGMEDAIS